jgi:hypothetical protein
MLCHLSSREPLDRFRLNLLLGVCAETCGTTPDFVEVGAQFQSCLLWVVTNKMAYRVHGQTSDMLVSEHSALRVPEDVFELTQTYRIEHTAARRRQEIAIVTKFGAVSYFTGSAKHRNERMHVLGLRCACSRMYSDVLVQEGFMRYIFYV